MRRPGYGNPNRTSRARRLRRGHDGFHFTAHMHSLLADVAARLPELAHVAADRVAVAFSQIRKPVPYGLHATLTPMRFEGGHLITTRRGRRYRSQRLYNGAGREVLYILRFYLPRFQDAPFTEKLTTVLHELWHISPGFDGDLRRHGGRCYVHSHSQEAYDGRMRRLADRYLATAPPEELLAPLGWSFAELRRRYGRVCGAKISHPKLIPAESERVKKP